MSSDEFARFFRAQMAAFCGYLSLILECIPQDQILTVQHEMYEASGMELLFEINGNFAVEIHIEDGITCKLHHNGDEVCMTVHDLDEVQDTESARHSMKTLLLPFASRTGNVFERTEPIALSLN